MALPRFVVLYSQTAGKYVGSTDLGAIHALLIIADKVWSPYAKLEVEPSKLHPSMVHIRYCYNNKYLRRSSSAFSTILPEADQPNDDLTQWSSTLFLPELSADGGIRLLHVQLNRYAQPSVALDRYYVEASGQDPLDPKAQFQFVDWETLVTLPKHLAFKGDNGHYLGLLPETGAALRFRIEDAGDKSAANVVVARSDATFRIRNVSRGAYWRLNAAEEDYIWADDLTADAAPDSGSVFEAIKVRDGVIAVRNLGNQKLCKRFSTGEIGNRLKAGETQITQYAELSLAELVTSRRIEDINFRFLSGWVDDVTRDVVLNPGEPVTNESDYTQTLRLEIRYKDIKSCTWEAAGSTMKKLGPVVEFQPQKIASVNDSSAIELIAPFAPSYLWGETTRGDPNQVKPHAVTLPPWTTVTVKLSASSATCNVPFTYTRYDVLDEATAEEEVHYMEDGLYTGTNYFNFKFEDGPPQAIPKKT